jgi:hypothetical protein
MIRLIKNNLRLVGISLFILVICSQNTIANTPEENSSISNQFPNFSWMPHVSVLKNTGKPIEYIIQISRAKKFTDLIDVDTIAINRYVCDRPLPTGRIYWRVRAIPNNSCMEKWYPTNSFTLVSPTVKITVGKSVGQALSEARSLTKKGNIVELDFLKGEYNCELPTKYFMQIRDCENLIINGNGSTVNLLGANQTFCEITNCKNVIVKGFVIDYPKQMTFTQGRIVASSIEEGSIEVQLEPNFPTYEDKYFVENSEAPVMLLDPLENGKLKTGVPNYYQIDMKNIKKTGNRRFSLSFKNVSVPVEGKVIVDKVSNQTAKFFNVGDRFVHTTRGKESGNIMIANNSSEITCYDIKSYGVGGFHYAGYFCSEMNFLHCDALIKKGRWWQGNADGIHLRSNRIGPWVEYFNIQGIGDDGLALYARPMTIKECFPNGNKRQLILNSEHFYLEPKDKVTFFNPRDGKIVIETSSKKIEKTNGGWLVEFDDKLPENLVTVGAIQNVDQIWNRSASCGDFVIRNSKFIGIRRYGNVFRAKNGVIENNIYHGCSSAAIVFINETQYPNGLYCSNIIVRNNKISDCGFASTNTAPIFMMFKRLDTAPIVCQVDTVTPINKQSKQTAEKSSPVLNTYAESFGPNNILIENNDFSQLYSKKIIELWSVKDAVIRNNKLNEKQIENNNLEQVVLKHTSNITQE